MNLKDAKTNTPVLSLLTS